MNSYALAIANATLVRYPEAGGHLSVHLQYMAGLRALGVDFTWLELFKRGRDPAEDASLVARFIEQLEAYGVADACVVCSHTEGDELVSQMEPIGISRRRFKAVLDRIDVLWNLCGTLSKDQMREFPRRVLVDLDPGHLQASALTWDLGFADYDVRLTIGRRIGMPDCEVPDFGLEWKTFLPFVHLPMWSAGADPGGSAPFTSITQWNWNSLWTPFTGDRVLSDSKRDAYLRYLKFPHRARRPLQLAANILPHDQTGDRELLTSYGWDLVDPHEVAATPAGYRSYIGSSRAEFSCPKPVFRELRTGWVSDRSVAYLASGRPVLAESTGFEDELPVGTGLLAFDDMDSAVEGVAQIDSDWARHSRAARQLAEDYFDARVWLPRMIEDSR